MHRETQFAAVALAGFLLTACSASDVNQMPTGQAQGTSNTQSAAVEQASSVGCDDSALQIFRTAMQAVTNESRQQARMCGDRNAPAAGALVWNDKLADAAASHAADMVTHNFLDHDGSDGLSVSDRVETAGYDWRAVGENIAGGQRTVQEAQSQWLDSPGHCRNIMNADYTEFGAACLSSQNNDYISYWVVVFGNSR